MCIDAMMSPDVMSPSPMSENFRRQAIFAVVGRLVDMRRQTGRSLSPTEINRILAEEPAVVRYTLRGPRMEVNAAGGVLIPDAELRDMSRVQLNRMLRPLPANIRRTLRERRQRLKAREAARVRRERRRQEVADLRHRLDAMRAEHPRIIVGVPEPYDASDESVNSLTVNVSGSPPPTLMDLEEDPIRLTFTGALAPRVLWLL